MRGACTAVCTALGSMRLYSGRQSPLGLATPAKATQHATPRSRRARLVCKLPFSTLCRGPEGAAAGGSPCAALEDEDEDEEEQEQELEVQEEEEEDAALGNDESTATSPSGSLGRFPKVFSTRAGSVIGQGFFN